MRPAVVVSIQELLGNAIREHGMQRLHAREVQSQKGETHLRDGVIVSAT